MRRRCGASVAALSCAMAVVLAGCAGPDVTAGRVDDAVGPAFASLYARQQALLGHPVGVWVQASADCRRFDVRSTGTGAGDDWVCALLLNVTGPSSQYTYELNVRADGCYEADGPPALVGGRTLTTPSGQLRVNPLFAFDGCFDT